jgi:hypothetical protein
LPPPQLCPPRRALESFCLCCCDWGWLSPRWVPPRLDVLLFALGVAAITHCYSDSNGVHRDVFRCVCWGGGGLVVVVLVMRRQRVRAAMLATNAGACM